MRRNGSRQLKASEVKIPEDSRRIPTPMFFVRVANKRLMLDEARKGRLWNHCIPRTLQATELMAFCNQAKTGIEAQVFTLFFCRARSIRAKASI